MVAAGPHVLLISIDTLRAGNLSSYGYERNTSPHLDALFASGARFTNARTVEPLTGPALASMLTALEPHEHGATRNGLRMRKNLFSFSKSLGRRGYETAAFVGNWTLRDPLSGMGEHFELYEVLLTRKRWFGFLKSEATADDLNAAALDWLEEHLETSDKPFLLWVHTVEPHAPYQLKGDFLGQIGVKRSGTFLSARNRYDSEVAFADDRAGQLLEWVYDRVPPEDVLVVFLSDHGESLGEHGYWGHGRHLYENSLRIPLGLSWPGKIEPRVIDADASILDLPRTLLSLVGEPSPEFLGGYDWAPVLLGKETPSPGRVTYYQAHRASVEPQEEQTRLREKGLLAVARIEDGRKEIYRIGKNRRVVYDLASDPAEKRPVEEANAQPSEGLRGWLARVIEGLAVADELPPPNLTDEDLEALRALGYID